MREVTAYMHACQRLAVVVVIEDSGLRAAARQRTPIS